MTLSGVLQTAFAFLTMFTCDALAWDCPSVSVRAVKTVNGVTYQQKGIAVAYRVYSDDRKSQTPYLVTLDHVIDGADHIYIGCGPHEIEVKALASSPTSDIAVLLPPQTLEEINKTQVHAIPVFSLNPKFDYEPDTSARAISIHAPKDVILDPTEKDLVRAEVGTKLDPLFHIPSSPFLPMPASQNVVVVRGTAVQPGTSGAAVSGGTQPLGLVALTYARENVSLAIPFADVLKTLRNGLANGRDPYAVDSDHPGYITADFTPDESGKLLRRTYQLHVKSNDGPEWIIKDSCQSRTYTMASQWEAAAGGDYSRPGGDYSRPAGSATEGEGQLGDLAIEPGLFDHPAPGFRNARRSFYIPSSSERCPDGVLLPNGRRLVGLKDQDTGIIPIQSVYQLFNLLEQRGTAQFRRLIEKDGIFADDVKTRYSPLCETGSLAKRKNLRLTDQQISCPDLILHSEPIELWNFTQTLGPATYHASHPKTHQDVTLSCNAKTGALRLKSPASGKNPLSADLTITARSIRGSIQIGQCRIPKFDAPKDFWSGVIRSQDFDLNVDVDFDTLFSPGSPQMLIRIRPTRIEPRCLQEWTQSSQKKPILNEFVWRVSR